MPAGTNGVALETKFKLAELVTVTFLTQPTEVAGKVIFNNILSPDKASVGTLICALP